MMIRFRPPASPRKDTLVRLDAVQLSDPGAKNMRWETPQATDFRFGMEITLYIANR